jgi:hypothetical protein
MPVSRKPRSGKLRVLVACEFSNTVRDAFLARGHDAYSCDLVRADHPNPNWRRHIQGDVRPLLRERWDLVIAHPPCTYLSNVGACFYPAQVPPEAGNPQRYACALEAVAFFLKCLNANAPKVCVENPRPLTFIKKMIGGSAQVVHPWQYGHAMRKETHLWLRGLAPLMPTCIVTPTRSLVRHGKVLKSTGCRQEGSRCPRDRSRTFSGIARAMAEQWG